MYTQNTDEGSYRSMLFIENLEHLIGLNKLEAIEINEAYLVSPGFINKTNKWHMNRLSKVLESKLIHESIEFPIYKFVFDDCSEIIYNPTTSNDATNDTYRLILEFN